MAKSPKKRSEDGIVVTPDFIAVIDGSTSKSRQRCHRDYSLRQRSNGELAMTIIAHYIKEMDKAATCHQFCTGVTKAVARRYKKAMLPHLAQHPEDRLTASCAVFSRLRREVWLVGDCHCLIGDAYYDNPKPYEQQLAQQRADIIKASPLPWNHFLDDDTARQAVIPHMLECMQQQNKTYSVVDGFAIPERYVPVITLDFQPWQVVLATDGYPFLRPTLEESEQCLSSQREKDPLNIGPDFMATKGFAHGQRSFDDRAYIRFSV